MAPAVGFEPTTLRLTAECSAVELRRNIFILSGSIFKSKNETIELILMKRFLCQGIDVLNVFIFLYVLLFFDVHFIYCLHS